MDQLASFRIHELALHYRREALNELEGRCPWLKPFRSLQPDSDLTDALGKFFEDGSKCIADLEKHMELVELAVINALLTDRMGLLYIIFMAELQKDTASLNILEPDAYQNDNPAIVHEIKEMKESIRKDASLDNRVSSFLEAAEQMLSEPRAESLGASSFDGIYYTIFSRACEAVSSPGFTFEEFEEAVVSTVTRVSLLPVQVNATMDYNFHLKRFAYKVGCAEAHTDPKRNIAELRKFHSTQMRFFQKLQHDLQAQIKLNKEQQEIITALVFRHLIEHLPPNPYKSKTSSTDRWLAFWEDAVRKEYDNPVDHPLKGLVSEKVFRKLSTPHTSPSGRSITRDSQGAIDEIGEKAQMYRWGKELFGILSKNIHAFEVEGSKGYEVASDHWGKGFREILKRLKPIEYDHKDGSSVVNWERERLRYV